MGWKKRLPIIFMIFFFRLFLAPPVWASTAPHPSEPPIQKWCTDLRNAVSQLKWKLDPCDGIQWQIGGNSVQGRPLVYAEFGDSHAENTTLIFSAVHGDEITPLYLGIQLIHWIRERQDQLGKTRVVIAPLV